MTDNININRGKRITINGDPARVIEFDPGDIVFAEKFYSLMRDFDSKMAEFQKQSDLIKDDGTLDENGLPVSLGKRLEFMREVSSFIRGQIDHVFGAGTCQKAFGDSFSLDMVKQLLEGLTPFIEGARSEKIKPYVNTVTDKKRRHTVMK